MLLNILTFILGISSVYGYVCRKPSGTAYITMHSYSSDTPTSAIACSDGDNGLIKKYGWYDISSVYPYVSASSFIVWNSNMCGMCVELQNGSKKVKVNIIDGCGRGANNETHFDMSQPSFAELFGDTGIQQGHGYASWKIISPNLC